MSYKNNWLKSLSESYITNNRGQVNLSEELASQVALNEQLVDLVEALCEELGVDPQDLLEDDGTIKEDFKGAVKRAGTRVGKVASAINRGVNRAERRIGELVGIDPPEWRNRSQEDMNGISVDERSEIERRARLRRERDQWKRDLD